MNLSAALLTVLICCTLMYSHAQSWKDLYQQSSTLYREKKYNDAAPVVRLAITAAKSEFGEKHNNYVQTLNLAGFIFSFTGDRQQASRFFSEVIQLTGELDGKNSAAYARVLYNTAIYYKDGEEYLLAEPLITASRDIREKLFGKNHPDYLSSLIQTGILYARLNRLEQASQTGEEALALSFQQFGESHQTTWNAAYALATTYTQMQLFAKAEPVFTWLIENFEKAKKQDSPVYLHTKLALGNLYAEIGQHEKAADLLTAVMNGSRQQYGENSSQFVSAINNLASFYLKANNYSSAEPLLQQSVAINKIMAGTLSKEYAKSLNNLAAFCEKVGKYDLSVQLLKEAENVFRNTLGENHPAFTRTLTNTAWVYQKMNEYDKAAGLLLRAKEINQKKGEGNPYYIETIGQLGRLYIQSGKIKEGGEQLKQALRLSAKYQGEMNVQYQHLLGEVASYYEQVDDIKNAEALLNQRNKLLIAGMIRTFSVLSEKEKENYLDRNAGLLESNNSFLYRHPGVSEEFYETSFAVHSILKSLSLSFTRNVISSARRSGDPQVRKLLNEWDSIRIFLAREYSLPPGDRTNDIGKSEKLAEDLEKKLNLFAGKMPGHLQSMNVSTKDLQSYLSPEEASIEFVRFNVTGRKGNDSIFYAAYILRKDMPPIFTRLCEERQLAGYFSPSRGATSIKSIYRSEVTDEEETTSISGDSLYLLIWKPLEKSLKGIRIINYSPAGLLHKVAFHALPAGDSLLLMDRYRLRQFLNTRSAALKKVGAGETISAALMGNSRFTLEVKEKKEEGGNPPGQVRINLPGKNKSAWQPLPGTLTEVESIKKLFENKDLAVAVFSGENASEETFKSFSGRSPSVIHMATHGFFLPDPDSKNNDGITSDSINVFEFADNPLLRSGVVLSGANAAWAGESVKGREDGILTAYEISQVDLRNTELVVLSACETALGDIKGNEGVYGLQRAFRIAGANKMLLSLWKVPDRETAELMQYFYNFYLKDGDGRASLAAAQEQMRKKYSPYYWAAFVLIE